MDWVIGSRTLDDVIGDQAAAFEEGPEAGELLAVAELLQLEVLEGLLGFVAVIEAEGDEVGDDAAGAIGEVVEVIPALLDGGAAVELVVIEIGGGVFELDDGADRARLDRGEIPEDAVGGADAGDEETFCVVVGLWAGGGGAIVEGLTEHFLAEGVIEGGFVAGEVAVGFEVGPAKDDGVRDVDFGGAIGETESFVIEIAGKDEGAMAAQGNAAEEMFGLMDSGDAGLGLLHAVGPDGRYDSRAVVARMIRCVQYKRRA